MNKHAQFIRIGLLVCLTIGMVVTVQPARASTLEVCPPSYMPPCPFPSITVAVAAAQAGDTITVAAGTYYEHDIMINNNLTIVGAGADKVTVDAGNAGRIFNIPYGVTASISGMTITHGRIAGDTGGVIGTPNYGGGINNDGNLTLVDVIVTNNTAVAGTFYFGMGGGIASSGNLTVINSLVTHNSATSSGAGIYVYRGSSPAQGITTQLTRVLIQDNIITGNNTSTFVGDQAGLGGGILLWNYPTPPGQDIATLNINQVEVTANAGDLVGGGIYASNSTTTITNSTISTNTAQDGGGIWQYGPFSMTNDTVAGNVASNQGGGLYLNADANDPATLTNVTVARNSGGIDGGIENAGNTRVNLADTISALNTANSGGPDCSGLMNSLDYNLLEDTSGCSIKGATTHNITGKSPLLGPLADYGGPTQTLALLPGSPAIDAGNNSTCANTDQRGVVRPVGPACDIGAFERKATSKTIIVSDNPNPSFIGESVSVLVSVSGGPQTPTGLVAISGADSNCMITLSAGSGMCSVIFLTDGTKTLTATYLGDATHEMSKATASHLVWMPVFSIPANVLRGWAVGISNSFTGIVRGLMPVVVTSAEVSSTSTPFPTPLPTLVPSPVITASLPSPVVTMPTAPLTYIPHLNAFCRSGPDTIFHSISLAMKGQAYPIDGRNEDDTWFFLRLSANVECWVPASVGQASGGTSGVPVMLPIPTPTFTAPPAQQPVDCGQYKSAAACQAVPACTWVHSIVSASYCTKK